MTLNIKKTKIVTFNKRGRHIRGNFYFGKEKLETAREYKYLGFLVTPSGEINLGFERSERSHIKSFSQAQKQNGYLVQETPEHCYKTLQKPTRANSALRQRFLGNIENAIKYHN